MINAIHAMRNGPNDFGIMGNVIGKMVQDATKHRINWLAADIKSANVGIYLGQKNPWPLLQVPLISHIITDVSTLQHASAFTQNNNVIPVAVAEHSWKMLKQLNVKAELIENVARPKFTPGPKDSALAKDVPVLVYCGNLTRSKGIDKLVKAVIGIKCELWLIGSKISISQQANIKMLGLKTETEVINYLRSADVFVFPSLTEGMSLSLLEAMAVGLPCVVTNIEANKDTCKNAAVYVDTSVESLRSGIIKMISSKQLQQDMSGAALEVASTRKYDVWGERFASLIEATAC
jgi:glycosyltransferase involved in cell wall biosynthesis